MSYFRTRTGASGEVLVPLDRARSGWGEQIRGTAISGALARAAQSAANGLDDAARFRPVRWTLDMFRPAAMGPSSTESVIVRNGRRLRLVGAAFVQDGRAVAHARLLLLARGGDAPGTVWTGPPPWLPPLPEMSPAGGDGTLFFSADIGWTATPAAHRNAARKATWNEPVAVIEGADLSPFQHVAAVADRSNLVASWGDEGVTSINTDLTVALTRLPDIVGGIGVVAGGRTEACGVAVATTVLFDRAGPLGTVLVSTLANGAHAVDPDTAVF